MASAANISDHENLATWSGRLLGWFDSPEHRASERPMPWRQVRDPYRVLLSEIMLQQTQVATVIPYYEHFLKNWPTLDALAQADEQAVLKAWEGLGYYSRARNLLECVRQVKADYQGVLPKELKELQKLKGIGDYTAGAIRSIAYSLPAAAVDGNVVRVTARLMATAWDPTDPADRRLVSSLVLQYQPPERPGDFNEALMDLGATVCLPKAPRCTACPLQAICQAFLTDATESYPRKKEKAPIPVETKLCLIHRHRGLIHVNRRPAKGLLANLFEFDWAGADLADVQKVLGEAVLLTQRGQKRHVFSHRIWDLTAYQIDWPDTQQLSEIYNGSYAPALFTGEGQWIDEKSLQNLPFSTALADWRDEMIVGI